MLCAPVPGHLCQRRGSRAALPVARLLSVQEVCPDGLLFPTGVKQKGPAPSSSLMHSESELDSDDAIFTWPDREKGKLPHGQNGSVPNGQTPLKVRSAREEIL